MTDSMSSHGENTPAETPLRISLKRTPLWTGTLVVVSAVALMFTFLLLFSVVPHWSAGVPLDDFVVPLLNMGFVLGFIGAVIGLKAYVRSRPLHPITFEDTTVTLPAHLESTRTRQIRYRDITAIALRGPPYRPQLLVETQRYIFVLPRDVFVEADGMERTLNALRLHLMASSEGRDVMDRMRQQRELAEQMLQQRPMATQGLLGVTLVLFANLYLLGALESPLGMVSWGANLPALVQDGQWFRVLVAPFLHGSIDLGGGVQLLLACFILYYLAGLLERVVGSASVLIVYLGSAFLSGILCAWAAQNILYAGAWGGIYGLLGAILVLGRRFRTQLPPGFRQPVRWWGHIALLSVLLHLLVSNVDWLMQGSGFIAGMVLMSALLYGVQALPLRGRIWSGVLAALLVLIGVGGLVEMVDYSANYTPDEERRAAEIVIRAESTHPTQLNQLAWLLVQMPEMTQQQLELGLLAAQRAFLRADTPELEALRPVIEDTLATAYHRLGNGEEAIRHELNVLHAEPSRFIASQLGRFLHHHVEAAGAPLVMGDGAAPPPESLRVRLRPNTGAGPMPNLDIGFLEGMQEPLEQRYAVYALAYDIEEGPLPVALLRAVLPVGLDAEVRGEAPQLLTLRRGVDELRWEVAMVTRAPEDTPALPDWRAWTMDALTRRLP